MSEATVVVYLCDSCAGSARQDAEVSDLVLSPAQ